MNILFLDDDDKRIRVIKSLIPSVKITTTANNCIKLLRDYTQSWDYVMLDHDLGGETYCDPNRTDVGMEVVRFICSNRPSINNIIIHTQNDRVNTEMRDLLRKFDYKVLMIPFYLLKKHPIIIKIQREVEKEYE